MAKHGCFVFDSLVESCGEASVSYIPSFQEQLLGCINHRDPGARQASCYGIGILAQYGGPAFAPACKIALPLLARACTMGYREDFLEGSAVDNAVSAIGKVLLYRPESVENKSDYVEGWIHKLPIAQDLLEGIPNYEFLCQILGNPQSDYFSIITSNETNLAQTIEVLAAAARDQPQLKSVLKTAIQTLQSSVTAEAQQASWTLVSPEAANQVLRIIADE